MREVLECNTMQMERKEETEQMKEPTRESDGQKGRGTGAKR